MDPLPHETRSGFRKAIGALFALAFLAGITAPAFLAWWDEGHWEDVQKAVLEERRAPHEFPAWPPESGADYERWPGRFEVWWSDAFGLRTQLIRWHNLLRLFLFRVTPGPAVLLGRDENDAPWMYVSIQHVVDDFRGLLPFPEDDLRHWKTFLEQRRDGLAAQGCRYVFVIAPNKSSIYPEYYPPEFTRIGEKTRADEFVAYLRAHSDVPVIDLRRVLLDAKTLDFPPLRAGARLYFPLGTHWTTYGAWVGHLEIMRTLKPWFPSLGMTPLRSYRVNEIKAGVGDTWATRFHIGDLLKQGFPMLRYVGPPEVSVKNAPQGVLVYESQGGGPTAVLLRDSFSTQLAPHLAPHFGRLVVAWNQVLGPEFTLQVIEQIQPELVIEQVVERYLSGALPPLLPRLPAYR